MQATNHSTPNWTIDHVTSHSQIPPQHMNNGKQKYSLKNCKCSEAAILVTMVTNVCRRLTFSVFISDYALQTRGLTWKFPSRVRAIYSLSRREKRRRIIKQKQVTLLVNMIGQNCVWATVANIKMDVATCVLL